MKNNLSYIAALIWLNVKVLFEKPVSSLLFALSMFCQDIFLFAAWAVFFGAVGRVRGWGMPEIFLLYGIIFCSYGFSAVFFNGIRHLGYKVNDGELDVYLTRPRNPLPALYITRCNPGGLGDIASGLIFLAFFSGLHTGQFFLAAAVSVLTSILFESMKLIFYSLNFFFHNGSRFGDYLTDALFYLTTVPQQSQSFMIKIALFTIMPAGFVSLFPVYLVQRDSVLLLGAQALVVAFYVSVAIGVFHLGIRRYKQRSGA